MIAQDILFMISTRFAVVGAFSVTEIRMACRR
jgi:hypothetical protein